MKPSRIVAKLASGSTPGSETCCCGLHSCTLGAQTTGPPHWSHAGC